MSAESPRHVRGGGPLTVPSQPPSDRSIIDAVSGFINDVTLSSTTTQDPKDVIQWARFETADINEPTPEGDSDNDISPLLLILGYGSGVQVWLIPPSGDAQEVLSWRQGTVKVLRILPSPQHGDCFASKRPLIALCDSASPGPSFCSLSFISIRGGEQVKSIKFKNPILDVLANKRSVVVSFSERFAVFDAATLEDRMTVTTCYPCPCPLGGSAPINPLALGARWLAYADKKLNQSKRSSGGCESEGVTSYTATVLHAAKSLSKGLRGLGETVAQSLGGGRSTSQSPSPPNADIQQPGVVTILDIEGTDDDDGQDSEEPFEPMVAHFVAHSEAVIAMSFDASGLLLVTADRRGHDFHVFRLNPHPCGPSLAAVHHLYVLHRGDTTAKVQDIAISWDSRWAAISTLRGTTHVFAISAYGGAPCVRTHTQPRVVNRLSRFHRSAGLPIAHTAHSQPTPKRNSASPVSEGLAQGAWFPNPRLPPYPVPITLQPLAQLRPTANLPTHTITRTSAGRQRLSSLSEDSNSAPLLARCSFGMYVGSGGSAPVTALYLMAANGSLLHLVLHPRASHSIPKEKVCDSSAISVEVEAAAQWPLQRPAAAADLLAPLPPSNPLLQPLASTGCADMCMSEEERWLSQVEIVTHAGPHRRLWMGPQFVFKTYNCTGSSSSLSEAETVEVEFHNVARSNPVNVPTARPIVPVLIDSGSASSLEQSPSDGFRRRSMADVRAPACDLQLREDLAEAMKEDHGRELDASAERPRSAQARPAVARAVDPAGCVVADMPSHAPPPLETDSYIRANDDEATFRPVVRAPAAIAPASPVDARPLPRGTTIPVQTCDATDTPQPGPALPLATHVLIPAALQRDCDVDAWLRAVEPPALPSGPADPQPAARPRSKKSPTESDGDRISCKVRDKDKKDDVCEDVIINKNRDAKSNVAKVIRESSVAKQIGKSSVPKNVEDFNVNAVREFNVDLNAAEDVREINIDRENKKYNAVEGIGQCKVENKDEKVNIIKREREYSPLRKETKENITREPSIAKEVSRSSVTREIVKSSLDRELRSFTPTKETRKSSEPKETRESHKTHKSNNSKETRERGSPKEPKLSKEIIMSREVQESKLTKEPKTRSFQSLKESGNKIELETSEAQTKAQSVTKEVEKTVVEDIKPSGKKESTTSTKETRKLSQSTVTENSIWPKPPKPYNPKEVGETSVPKEVKQPKAITSSEVELESMQTKEPKNKSHRTLKESDFENRSDTSEINRSSITKEVREPIVEDLNTSMKREVRAAIPTKETRKSSESKATENVPKSAKTNDSEDRERSLTKESKQQKEVNKSREIPESMKIKEPKIKSLHTLKELGNRVDLETSAKKESVSDIEKSSIVSSTMPIKSDSSKGKYGDRCDREIKTEEQAWDMLLNESKKPLEADISQQPVDSDKITADVKPKSKRNRKNKKAQDDLQTKVDEDSFVEIHAIENKEYPSTDDLVSISTPYEELESSSFYLSKTKKAHSPKSLVSEKCEGLGEKCFDMPKRAEQKSEDIMSKKVNKISFDDEDLADIASLAKTEKTFIEHAQSKSEIRHNEIHQDSSYLTTKGLPKTKKSKSLSPYSEDRKIKDRFSETKDVYVIDTSKDDFPEIQITMGKSRKRSPQPKPVDGMGSAAEVPVKSWSSIAASKSVKKVENIEKQESNVEKKENICLRDELRDAAGIEHDSTESSNVSLQEKLIELCKRTDIMVAECDAPSELNFVEEHHAVLHDLPPLEPLDFGLDDFNLEVMRDSLLEVNDTKLTSPICKINIDDILSSIKETTSRVIESSTFNLIDLEKVPAQKEKGFSVIESHKITSQEVKLEDYGKSGEKEEIMEKSSDDDGVSNVVSTDSDKDDKKGSVVLPPSKQSSKSKKSRRKKK